MGRRAMPACGIFPNVARNLSGSPPSACRSGHGVRGGTRSAYGGQMLRSVTLRRALQCLLGAVALVVSRKAPGAEGPVALAMTLPEAIAYARSHHPELLLAGARVSAAAAAADVPRARWLPTASVGLELLLGTTNNSTASYLPLPGVGLPRIGAT